MGIELSFLISELPSYAISYKMNRKTLEIAAFDGCLSVFVQYGSNRAPLTLESKVKVGDFVKVRLYSHRIELYVNEILADEEWPFGELLYALNDKIETNLSITGSECTESNTPSPSVIGEITAAEGWRPEENVFVGDCMPYEKDGEFHVLYLKDRHHHKSKWGYGAHQWEHISTKDFSSWQIHPTAVAITDPEEASICTGSWIRRNGIEYLFYTVRRPHWKPAPISRSISSDGYHFEKDKSFGFTISEKYKNGGARDPKIIEDESGLYHMILTTGLRSDGRGCLAHYVSQDLNDWREIEDPLYISEDETAPECPDYFKFGGRYYLVFSLHGKARYMISDKPFDSFREPEHSEIPCKSVPKAAIFGDRIIFAGFESIGGYAGTMTFKAARANENGELIFESL